MFINIPIMKVRTHDAIKTITEKYIPLETLNSQDKSTLDFLVVGIIGNDKALLKINNNLRMFGSAGFSVFGLFWLLNGCAIWRHNKSLHRTLACGSRR